MNPENLCHLEGTVQGDCWTRYRPSARGQVRFWLGVVRPAASPPVLDQLLCAIEPKNVLELDFFKAEIRTGRRVRLSASACTPICSSYPPQEDHAHVIFVAESCGFDGAVPASVHRHQRATGKMAAAGDGSLLEAQS